MGIKTLCLFKIFLLARSPEAYMTTDGSHCLKLDTRPWLIARALRSEH